LPHRRRPHQGTELLEDPEIDDDDPHVDRRAGKRARFKSPQADRVDRFVIQPMIERTDDADVARSAGTIDDELEPYCAQPSPRRSSKGRGGPRHEV
jgi:hypothetical protein